MLRFVAYGTRSDDLFKAATIRHNKEHFTCLHVYAHYLLITGIWTRYNSLVECYRYLPTLIAHPREVSVHGFLLQYWIVHGRLDVKYVFSYRIHYRQYQALHPIVRTLFGAVDKPRASFCNSSFKTQVVCKFDITEIFFSLIYFIIYDIFKLVIQNIF